MAKPFVYDASNIDKFSKIFLILVPSPRPSPGEQLALCAMRPADAGPFLAPVEEG